MYPWMGYGGMGGLPWNGLDLGMGVGLPPERTIPPRPEVMWFSANFIVSWANRGPLNQALVTFGDINDPSPGSLGQPNTSIAVGVDALGMGSSTGVILDGGIFLDAGHNHSLEMTGWILGPESAKTVTASDRTGRPLIARPFFRTDLGTEGRAFTSVPDQISGSTDIELRSEFGSFETNYRNSKRLSREWVGDWLVGFRYATLREALTFQDRLNYLVTGFPFLGLPLTQGDSVFDQDKFACSNNFYGVNFGGRLQVQQDWYYVSFYTKAAIGVTNQRTRIEGFTTLTPGSPGTLFPNPVTVPGGVLALPSNIGRHTRSVFGILPEAGVTLGVQPIEHVRLTAGYSFLFWNAVARPGSQLDRVVNPGLIPTSPTFGTPGADRPAFSPSDSTYRLHTLSLGVELYY
jgi:hypothetical protein